MKNKQCSRMPPAGASSSYRTRTRRLRSWRSLAVVPCTGCSSKSDDDPADIARDGQQRDADASPAPKHPPLHRRVVQISQDDRGYRGRRFRQRSGHQRVGALFRSGVAAAGFARRSGQERRTVGGGGFARLCHGHQHLSQGTRHRQDRPSACRPRQGSDPASRRCSARSGAGGNRRRQRRG